MYYIPIANTSKKIEDQCEPWDPIGIANECTLINNIT